MIEVSIYEAQRDLEQKPVHILLYNTEVTMHFHESIEILYVVKGEVEYRSNIHHHILHEGQAVFIPPYFSHYFTSLTPSETETLIIPSKYLVKFLKDYPNTYFSKLDNQKYNQDLYLFFKMFRSYQELGISNELLYSGFANHLLGFIATKYPSYSYKKLNTLMVKISIYLNENFQKDITLKMVANHFGYNISYFSRLFKNNFRCTFPFYLNNIRYNYVLSHPNTLMPIEIKIFEAGFNSISSFYRHKKLLETPAHR